MANADDGEYSRTPCQTVSTTYFVRKNANGYCNEIGEDTHIAPPQGQPWVGRSTPSRAVVDAVLNMLSVPVFSAHAMDSRALR